MAVVCTHTSTTPHATTRATPRTAKRRPPLRVGAGAGARRLGSGAGMGGVALWCMSIDPSIQGRSRFVPAWRRRFWEL